MTRAPRASGPRIGIPLLAAALLVTAGLFLRPGPVEAEPVTVRHAEGLVHGFLVLRTLTGQVLADGDLSQFARGEKVTTKLVFRFRDGSYHEETAVFSQRGQFRMLSDHVVQRGPSFPHALDLSIDNAKGRVVVRYADAGKEKVADEQMDLPADLANGMISILLKNLPPGAPKTTLSMVAATPKPRLVKLVVTAVGEEAFTVGRTSRKAMHFVLKVEIGGVGGLVAPLVGKEPPDNHVWILRGETPVFVKSEAPLYVGGPTWRIELTHPTWSRAASAPSHR